VPLSAGIPRGKGGKSLDYAQGKSFNYAQDKPFDKLRVKGRLGDVIVLTFYGIIN
jgi:hypothetical protein